MDSDVRYLHKCIPTAVFILPIEDLGPAIQSQLTDLDSLPHWPGLDGVRGLGDWVAVELEAEDDGDQEPAHPLLHRVQFAGHPLLEHNI